MTDEPQDRTPRQPDDTEPVEPSSIPPTPEPPRYPRDASPHVKKTSMHPCLVVFLVTLGVFVVGILLLFGLCVGAFTTR